MIWHDITRLDVVAVTAMHNEGKKRLLNLRMSRLRSFLDFYYGGFDTYKLKMSDRCYGDPRDRRDYRGGVAVQMYLANWMQCIDAIPLQHELGFNDRYHYVAVHHYCLDPKQQSYFSIDQIAAELRCNHQTVWNILQGSGYISRQKKERERWPHGKPGVNDWLIACEKLIEASGVIRSIIEVMEGAP